MVRLRVLTVLVSGLIIPGMLSAPSMAAPGGLPVAIPACADGGYKDWVDTAGNPFKNAAQCAKYVLRGGTLMERPTLTLEWSEADAEGHVYATITGAGLSPSAQVVLRFDGATPVDIRIVSPDGKVSFTVGFYFCDNTGYVVSSIDRFGNPIEAAADPNC